MTGGAGFIGVNFLRHWRRSHEDALVILDALTYAGNQRSLDGILDQPGVRFVHGDICDQELVLELFRSERIDLVVHFAAESHVDRSITGPDAFIRTNVTGTHTLLKAAKAVWLDEGQVPGPWRFHHVSTDEVYGSLGPDDPPFSETTPYQPNSPYSASKAAADHLVRAYHHTYGLPVTTTNCSNNFGPYQFPEKLLPLHILNLLEGRPLPVYGTGGNIRDWLFVEDHCRAVELVIQRGRVGETYNIGSSNEWNNLDLCRFLCREMEDLFRDDPSLASRFPTSPASRQGACQELITFVKDRPGHDLRYAIDARKIKTELGFASTSNFGHAIRATIRWYIDHEDWWRPLGRPGR